MAAPEDRICTTILEMLNVEGIVLEPAGALSVDVLLDIGRSSRGGGSSASRPAAISTSSDCPKSRSGRSAIPGLKKYLILRLPQRPGALRDFLDLLGPERRYRAVRIPQEVGAQFRHRADRDRGAPGKDFEALFERMDAAGFVYRDITGDEIISSIIV